MEIPRYQRRGVQPSPEQVIGKVVVLISIGLGALLPLGASPESNGEDYHHSHEMGWWVTEAWPSWMRKRIALAISSGKTALPIGREEFASCHSASENRERTRSVATRPGETTFTVMPRRTTSSASDLEKPTTPSLAAR